LLVVGGEELKVGGFPKKPSGDFQVSENPTLQNLTAPLLTTISGTLDISKNAALNQCFADVIKVNLTNEPAAYYPSGNTGSGTCPTPRGQGTSDASTKQDEPSTTE